MAIVKKEDQDEIQQAGMDILGDQPAMNQAQQQAQTSSQPGVQVSGGPSATIQGGTPAQKQQAPQQANKGQQGSGMFTNIRKYVQANKPQASKMAQAAGQQFGQQAGQVQQQVQEKQKSFQDRVAEQRARQNQAGQFAQQTLQQAGTQGLTPEQEDIQRFQKLMSGEQQFSNVGQLAVAPQSVQAQQLARQAALAERASGTSDLLRSTFGQQAPYTRGQQSLDSIILGGDQQARNQLVQQVQGTAEGLTGDIRDARQLAIAQAGELQRTGEEFREGLQESLGGQREGIVEDIDLEVERRNQELQQQREEFLKAFESGQSTADQIKKFIDEDKIRQDIQKQLTDPAKLKRMQQALTYNYNNPGIALYSSKDQYKNLMGQAKANQRKKRAYDADLQNYTQSLVAGGVDPQAIPNYVENYKKSLQQKYGNIPSEIKVGDRVFTGDESYGDYMEAYMPTNVYGQSGHGELGEIYNKYLKGRNFDWERFGKQLDTKGRYGGGAAPEKIGNIVLPALRDASYYNITPQTYINELIDRTRGGGRFDTTAMRDPSKALKIDDFADLMQTAQYDRGNVITEEQLARQKALAALAGQSGTEIERTAGPKRTQTFDLAAALKKLGYSI